MLTALTIDNIVLIDHLPLEMNAGLSVLTGETGAGKSILLDSLGLALGARADSGLIRSGMGQGQVTAVFELSADHPAFSVLKDAEIEAENPLILRRTLKTDGASRAFVNDQPVSAALLRSIGVHLIEIHGQHDERGLLDARGHRAMLDQFAAHDDLLDAVVKTHSQAQSARAALVEARTRAARLQNEEDYLKGAIAEFEEMAPEAGEEAHLAQERAQMQRATRMLTSLQDALKETTANGGPDAQLRSIIRTLSRLPDADDARLAPVLDAFDRAAIEASEAVRLLTGLVDEATVDPGTLDAVETRLFDLRALARKHNVQPDALPQVAEKLAETLKAAAQAQADLQAAETRLEAAQAAFERAAKALSKSRASAARRLDASVISELPPLKLEAARFRTVIEPRPVESWNAQGAENVAFEVSTNPGTDFGPLIKIASGGELARFILAMKVSLAQRSGGRTMIFDEVDRGIGGSTADAVGQRLARLAHGGAQVLVITHSPQVAALGAQHWRIAKSAQDGAARTSVTSLSVEDRREELARMLAGEKITAAARAAADSLLGLSG